jgi:hypothetical protein
VSAALFGDKAFDNGWPRKELDDRGALAVIPPERDRARPISCDFEMYKWRHLIENYFCNSALAFPPSCACWNLKRAPLKQMAQDRNPPRQDRSELCRHDQPNRGGHGVEMNA